MNPGESPFFPEQQFQAIAKQELAIYSIVNATQDVGIVAAAGSGKTRVVVDAVVQLGLRKVPWHRILLITFSKAAQTELVDRLVAKAAGKLTQQNAQKVSRTFASLSWATMKDRMDIEFKGRDGLGKPSYRCTAYRNDVADMWRCAIEGVSPEEAEKLAGDHTSDWPDADDEGTVGGEALQDLDASLVKLIMALQDTYRLTYAAGVDPGAPGPDCNAYIARFQAEMKRRGAWCYEEVLHAWSKCAEANYDYVIVDEAQDCSRVQLDIARKLAAKGRLILVGDPRQCIHEWRGSDPSIFNDHLRKPTTTFVELPYGWRSDPRITAEGNRVAALLAGGVSPSVAVGKEGTERCVVYRKNAVEDLVTLARGWRKGNPRIALLARTWKELQDAEAKLLSLGIPFIAKKKSWHKGHGEALEPRSNMPWGLFLDQARAWKKCQGQRGCVQRALVDIARNFPSYEAFDRAFQEYLLSNEVGLESRPVVLSTIHGTKGLEFDIVLLLAEGQWLSQEGKRRSEALRLLYVAVTRAQRGLLIYDPHRQYSRLR